MTARWAMVIDAERCVGCFNCHLACRDEHAGIDHLPVARAQDGASWIRVQLTERGTFPKVKVARVAVPCQQCEDAACVRAAPDAVYRRADGIVIIDPVKAAGRRDIVEACPHGAITWNAALALPQKCTFCAHLLDEGCTQPRCVEACPVQAITFGNLEDPRSPVVPLHAKGGLEELAPGSGSAPRVMYRGLPSRFVCGEVVLADRSGEPAVGVDVHLSGEALARHARTDAFGDFEFEGIGPGSHCVLRLSAPGYAARELQIGLQEGNLGTLVLDKA